MFTRNEKMESDQREHISAVVNYFWGEEQPRLKL